MNFRTPLARLRLIGLIEGISCVLLFFVAMPLKYLADQPLAVTVVGSAHGFLWMLYVLAVLHVWRVRRWSFPRLLLFGFASIPPICTFLLDGTLRREQVRAEQPPPETTAA
jgi:integral membrane protein